MPHTIAVVSDDIDMLAKQIVDITRPHEVKVTERIYLVETKNKDFKTACKLAKKVKNAGRHRSFLQKFMQTKEFIRPATIQLFFYF